MTAVRAAARRLAAALPAFALAGEVGSVSSISPVAILAVIIAAPITSAGRFWPCGPLGILTAYLSEAACFPLSSFPSRGVAGL